MTASSPLFDEHARELLVNSAIDPAVAAERGYRTISRPSRNDQRPRDEMVKLGIPTWAVEEDWHFPALLLPQFRATGEMISYQFKPRAPVTNRDGKKMKYASVKHHTNVLDVHPRWSRDRGQEDPALLPYIRDVGTPLYITEGIKKADSLTSRGLCTVALSGVYNWRSTTGTLGDWEDIPLRGREVTVVFDADAVTNRNVLTSMKRIGKWLKSKGATPYYLTPPNTLNGADTKGVDDFFAAGGALSDLLARIRSTPPEGANAGTDPFTDAALSEEVAGEALEGKFCFTSGLGWLQWTGRRWKPVDADAALEAVRQYVRAEYVAAIDRKRNAISHDDSKAQEAAEFDEKGWHKFQALNRLSALVKLAAGIEGVRRESTDFDRDPDVLNTPSGLLHLDTLVVEPHSPEHLVTLITGVDWKPGAENTGWKTILTSLPDGIEWYMQKRLGQAITGYPSDDDVMVLLAGGGANGKTVLMSTVVNALGETTDGTGYAQHIASELLLSGGTKGGATPEKMDLRGIRLAYMEETPEDRHLSVNTMKQIVGTPTIKGRKLYKDLVTFKSSHCIFLNTNFPPRITEVDDGSWRRIMRVDFPYRFRPIAVDDLGKVTVLDQRKRGPWQPYDRPADLTIKGRVDRGETEILEAALAWLVEGAHSWYVEGRSLDGINWPEPISDATDEWRKECDYLWAVVTERLTLDKTAWITAQDFYDELCDFMETQTRNARAVTPSQTTVMTRLKGHSTLQDKLRFMKKRGGQEGRSQRAAPEWGRSPSAGVGQDQIVSAIIGLRFRGKGEAEPTGIPAEVSAPPWADPVPVAA